MRSAVFDCSQYVYADANMWFVVPSVGEKRLDSALLRELAYDRCQQQLHDTAIRLTENEHDLYLPYDLTQSPQEQIFRM